MDIALLFKSIVGLVVILGFLVLMLVLPKKLQKKKEKFQEEESRQRKESLKSRNIDEHTLEKLHAVIKRKASTIEELQEALDLVIKYHPNIHKKLGIRPHPESDIYMDIIFKLCRHKNTNKTAIINFTNQLEKINPDYSKEINEAIMRGLNSRGL